MTYTNAADLLPRRRALGVSRRLRALAWMGHDPAVVAADYGLPGLLARSLVHAGIGTNGREYRDEGSLPPSVWHAAAVAFDDLCMTFGPSTYYRHVARVRCWRPPLAWDDDLFEDPTRAMGAGTPPNAQTFDEAVVLRRMNGDHSVRMRPEDQTEAVRRLHPEGHSDVKIADILGVWSTQVMRARRRLGLPSNEPDNTSHMHRDGLYTNRSRDAQSAAA